MNFFFLTSSYVALEFDFDHLRFLAVLTKIYLFACEHITGMFCWFYKLS